MTDNLDAAGLGTGRSTRWSSVRLDPTPSIGEVIDLDGVPDALERARRSEGPPRIVCGRTVDEAWSDLGP